MDLSLEYRVKYQLPSHIFILLHILQLIVNLSSHYRDSFYVQFRSSQKLFRIFLLPYRQMQEWDKVLHFNHLQFLLYNPKVSPSLSLASLIQYNTLQLLFWVNHSIYSCQCTQDSIWGHYHKSNYWNRFVLANALAQGITNFVLSATEEILWFYYPHPQSLFLWSENRRFWDYDQAI